jgi:hypothetical protein
MRLSPAQLRRHETGNLEKHMIRATILPLMLLTAAMLAVTPARAVTLSIDYTYDTGNFFGSGNPQGAAAGLQAKAALEAAANYFSAILDDTFSSIQTPPVYHGQYGGQVVWEWTKYFTNPTSGASVELDNEMVLANDYRIYVGARSLSGGTLGVGGPGGYGWSSTPTGGFTSAEIDEIDQITADFSDAVENRGESSGFARWGGVLAFDNDGSATWHFNHTTAPSSGTSDFYSTAIHELTHSLGFGEIFAGAPIAEWESRVSGSYFVGAAATIENGGPVTVSTVFGTSTSQETAMDPILTAGTRKLLTDLDAAALTDIGWTVVAPPGVEGDYNGNGIVDAADYTVWRDGLGTIYTAADYNVWKTNFGNTSSGSGTLAQVAVPEPGALALMVLGGLFWWAARNRRATR